MFICYVIKFIVVIRVDKKVVDLLSLYFSVLFFFYFVNLRLWN